MPSEDGEAEEEMLPTPQQRGLDRLTHVTRPWNWRKSSILIATSHEEGEWKSPEC